MSSDALAWLAFATTILFGILSIYFYFRSRLIKCLTCLVATVTLQKRSHPEVKITFRDKEVESLSRMLIFIWNSGTTDVRADDVPDENWPTLTFSQESCILSVAVLTTSTEHINFNTHELNDRTIRFKFSYLNPGDGGVIEVLFENKSQMSIPAFTAPLIGGASPDFAELPTKFRKDAWLSLLEAAGAMISGIGIAIWFADQTKNSVARYMLAAILFIGGLTTTIVTNYAALQRPHRRLPRFVQLYLKRVAAA